MGTGYKDHLDLTFFTNDENGSLLDRFRRVLKTTKYFDILVGYFRASGFYNLYESLEDVEKIRVIVGLKLDEHTWNVHRFATAPEQINFRSTPHIKSEYKKELRDDIQSIEDNFETNTGLRKFIEFIRSGKLEMKVYPHQAIHAKVYILRKPEGNEDLGRVITGSSNFSYSGLHENLEFNVELKQGYDVRFALDKFEKQG
jgi:HKD family nuclease